jgi:aminoglycoside phosphotransferase (APT) family kinase protein
VFHQAALEEADLRDRRAIYFAMAEALARLHAILPETVGLGDFGRPGNYFVRQFERWRKQWNASSITNIPALDILSAWLAENLPPDDSSSRIVHGDFRFGNLLFHDKRPEVVAILDWELATLGDPLADLGFACLPWHSTPAEYGGILGLDRDVLGLPAEQDFVHAYGKISSAAAKLQPFHIAFALFRFAVIFVGIAERVRDGIAASDNAVAPAALAASFAARGLEAAGLDPSKVQCRDA